jgi:acetolactate synthase-1/2/3 large subunit
MQAQRTGGQIVVDCLIAHGIDTAFCVPGESFLTVLDALHDVQDKIRVVVGRHEASTANMAEAYGKLTGRPGICFVTRGPGSSQASVAVHTAFQDSTPLILFIGQVAREQLGREAFQEIDYHHMFSKSAKWVTEIVDARRAPELISRAFHIATNGRPGPVVISLPEDMQTDICEGFIPAHFKRAAAAPAPEATAELQSMVETAERPLLILGGGGWSTEAVHQMRSFAERFSLPAIAGFRRQDLFDNSHPNYIGFLGFGASPGLLDAVRQSDLLLVVGERLGDTTTAGYSLIDIPRPRQKLIHVHAGAEELGILYEADLLINATARDFAAAMSRLEPTKDAMRVDWISKGRANFEKFVTPPAVSPQNIDVPRIVRELSERLPANAIISNGAGTYTGYVHKFYQYRDYGSQLAPTSGSMGYGLPAALAAKVVHPDRPVVCFAGDGCFLMASQELATAIMHDLPIVVIVIDNSSYGSIRVHQERHFPGRVFATNLVNPDFVVLAQSYGAYAERVEKTEDFAPAFDRAIASGRPALLTFKLDINKVVAFNPRNA